MNHCLNLFTKRPVLGALMLLTLFLEAAAGAVVVSGDKGGAAAILTNVQQVLNLGPYRARLQHQPAQIRGTVVVAMKYQNWLFVHDGTGCILTYATNWPAELGTGKVVEVDGISESGLQAPILVRAGLRIVGVAPLPEPERLSVARMMAGEGCWHYVHVEGVIRDMNRDAWNLALSVASGGKRFTTIFVDYARFKKAGMPLDWLESRVSLDGICWTDLNDRSQPMSFHLVVGNTNQIRIMSTGNTNLFALPMLKKEEAGRLSVLTDERLKITGTVTAVFRDERIFLETECGPVEATLDPFISRGMPNTQNIQREPLAPLEPGDRVELIGAPIQSVFAPELVDADYRKIGHGRAPRPVESSPEKLGTGEQDAQLVRLTAQLLAHERRSAGSDFVDALVLQTGDTVLEASWRSSSTNGLPAFPLKARLQVDGICITRPGPANVRRTSEILIRHPTDIVYLGQAPFWSSWPLRRFFWGGLTMGFAAAVWIYLLRRQVRQRTAALVKANEQLRENAARLHESETLFRTAFDASPAMVSLIRVADESMINANEALCRQSEYSREELVGRKLSEMNFWTSEEQRERFIQGLKDKGQLRDQEMTFRAKGGREETILLSADVIEVSGEPHILTVAVDITSRKQAEEEIQRALAQERELSRLKSHFVNTVSHEFRTPLGVIMSSAENLRDYHNRFSPEKRAEHLRDIFEATQTMSGLMEEVLLLGRVEAGKVVFRPEPLDLRSLCERLMDEVQTATNCRSVIQLTCEASDRPARGDEGLLRHILVNLLSNAVKYSPAGTPVKFRVEQRDAFAVFTISDQGIGIAKEDVPQLFESFHRGRNVGDIAGSGLGLVIVKRCVELHGGAIEYASGAAGEGSTFIARLPLFMKLA